MQYEKDKASPQAALFLEARKLILARPGVVETRKPRITTYGTDCGGICHLRSMPHGVDLGFLKGAFMADEPGRLRGSGKRLRVLSLESLDVALMDYYLDQAVDLLAG